MFRIRENLASVSSASVALRHISLHFDASSPLVRVSRCVSYADVPSRFLVLAHCLIRVSSKMMASWRHPADPAIVAVGTPAAFAVDADVFDANSVFAVDVFAVWTPFGSEVGSAGDISQPPQNLTGISGSIVFWCPQW